MPVYFSSPLWGARVLESVLLIFKSLSERTFPVDSSLLSVPVKSGVLVYFSIPAQGARIIESARQFERNVNSRKKYGTCDRIVDGTPLPSDWVHHQPTPSSLSAEAVNEWRSSTNLHCGNHCPSLLE